MKTKHLIIAFCIAVQNICAIEVWDGTSVSWTEGSGTKEDPYILSSPKHLAFLSDNVYNGAINTGGMYFKQTNDFDMANLSFRPIGRPYYAGNCLFSGIYDGDYHYIKNLNISAVDYYFSYSGNYETWSALFSMVGSCTLKNLICKNVVLTSANYMGSLVAYASEGGQVSIENCGIEANFASSDYGGGFVGCAQYGNITIKNSYFLGTISGGGIIGALIGKSIVNSKGGTYSIENCYARSNIGNIIGSGARGTVSCCYCQNGSSGSFNDYRTTSFNFTSSAMQSPSFLDWIKITTMEEPFIMDYSNINEGFPILPWQLNGIPIYKLKTICLEDQGFITDGGMYPENSVISIKATPKDDFIFSGWSDGNIDNPRSVTITSDTTFVALFFQSAYTIYVNQDCTIEMK